MPPGWQCIPIISGLLEQDGELISFINGMVSDEPDLRDEMYADASLHDESGAWQMIFGVNTMPAVPAAGYGRRVMERVMPMPRLRDARAVCSPARTGWSTTMRPLAFARRRLIFYSRRCGVVCHAADLLKRGKSPWSPDGLRGDLFWNRRISAGIFSAAGRGRWPEPTCPGPAE